MFIFVFIYFIIYVIYHFLNLSTYLLYKVSTGKEHYPSRAFECSTNHRGMITSVTRGFYGSVSDKSIVKFDGMNMFILMHKRQSYYMTAWQIIYTYYQFDIYVYIYICV
jgi:hypothetical protein